jgi:transcriptional regulator with XRE-family HTH domain
VRGRKERELVQQWSLEDTLGATIRAWRRYLGLTVTELAMRAGFGKNGRGYISKIEHNQIKRLGEESLAAIARALNISPIDLQQHRMPEAQESQNPGKEILDDAIVGCKAWLKVYRQDDNLLDCARTYFKLAELCWERMKLTEKREERGTFLNDALQSIDLALSLFHQGAPGSYEEAQQLRSMIAREILLKDLDDAIAGCKALLKISRQEERPLDWARTHTRLARLYLDRAIQSERAEERRGWLGKALQSIDQALPLFHGRAPVSYTQAQEMRLNVEAATEETWGSS